MYMSISHANLYDMIVLISKEEFRMMEVLWTLFIQPTKGCKCFMVFGLPWVSSFVSSAWYSTSGLGKEG